MKIVEEIVLYLERIGRLDSRDILFLRETGYLSYYFRTESERDEYEYQYYDYSDDSDYYTDFMEHEEMLLEQKSIDNRRRKQGRLGHFTGAKQRHAHNHRKILTANRYLSR